MIKSLYVVKDNKVGYLTPMVDDNDQTAYRNFVYALKNNGIMTFNKDDFSLYKIGAFDSDSAEIIIQEKELVVDGSSIIIDKE